MKVMVTGGAGFIGSHVVDAFVEAGHDVIVVDDLSTGRASNLNPKAKFFRIDIRDAALAQVFASERPEVVSHHAAQMDVRKSVADPLFDADVNVRGSLNVLECARLYGTRKIVYVSTGGAVFGEPEYLPCDEDHPIHPLCQYGVSKHTVEHYLYLYQHLYGLEYTVLRYPNVFGPRQNPQGEAGVIAIFIGKMLAGGQVVINGSGEQERDFVYVTDCARANLLAAAHGNGRIYNIGSQTGVSVNQLFRQLQSLTQYAMEPRYGPAKAGETFKIYLDSRRIQKELGWQMTVPLNEGLSRTVEYLRVYEQETSKV
jgi:UDP-glucose 4-epimerase